MTTPMERRFNFSLKTLLALTILPLAIAVCGVVHWRSLVRSEAEFLHAAHQELKPGIAVERVTQIMGREPGLRFEEPRLADGLLPPEETRRCAYTLVYTNPYYLDPAVYCYFDVDDELIAAQCFD